MSRTLVSSLGLGVAAAALTGGTGGLAAPLAAGLAGGVAGNLATDVFKALDRRIAERFLDGWSGIDENHHIERALRLAQIDALRITLKRFDDARATDQDPVRRSMANWFSHALAAFLKTETKVTQAVAFAKDGGLTPDERGIRAAVLEALPQAFDESLAARRAAGDRNAILASLVQLRTAVEAGVLAEIQLRTLPEGEAPPTMFRAAFDGSGFADGWFDMFLRDAAAKLKDGGAFAEIWNAEQTALIKAIVRAQGDVLSRIDDAIIGMRASLQRSSKTPPNFLSRPKRWRRPLPNWSPNGKACRSTPCGRFSPPWASIRAGSRAIRSRRN